MKKATLVIMAAGLGSRYGGIKQLEPVGPGGEIIMDYSIYDAMEAGFNKVVFIIRKDIEQDFYEVIGKRIEKMIEVEYVFQEIENLPEGFEKPVERTKPWGTGQAVLSCLGAVNEPFAVINADDYYGKEAFVKIHDFLIKESSSRIPYQFCMAGFVLGNTLSENGTVTRGVCAVNEENLLVDIVETSGIKEENNKGVAVNKLGEPISVNLDGAVSMNMWGFTPVIFDELGQGFVKFLNDISENELKAEYLLPEAVDKLIKTNKAEVHVLKTNDKWFGVTYKEDKEMVVRSFGDLVAKGIYPNKLYV
jgi:UTP-glucose-1-phosphate uridylyltransferase